MNLPSGLVVTLAEPAAQTMGEFLEGAPQRVREAWRLHNDRRGLLPPQRAVELSDVVLEYVVAQAVVDLRGVDGPVPLSALTEDDRRAILQAFGADARVPHLHLVGDGAS